MKVTTQFYKYSHQQTHKQINLSPMPLASATNLQQRDVTLNPGENFTRQSTLFLQQVNWNELTVGLGEKKKEEQKKGRKRRREKGRKRGKKRNREREGEGERDYKKRGISTIYSMWT